MSYSIEHTVQDGIERIAYRMKRRLPERRLVLQDDQQRIGAQSCIELQASAVDYGADYLMVEGAGHDLMLEKNSHQTAESIYKWLADKKIVCIRVNRRDPTC